MEKVKSVAGVVLLLCSATMACTGEDPVPEEMGRNGIRTVGPRLSNAKWMPCCRKAKIRPSCDPNSDALALLVSADKNCIDTALAVVEKRAEDDLAAAYYIRGQRMNDPVDYLRALKAAEDALRENAGSQVALFNLALAEEKLGLRQEAIRSWNEVVKRGESGWSEEAGQRRQHLQDRRDPEWRIDKLEEALRQRDLGTLTKIVRPFPWDSIRAFEESDLLDVETSRFFAEAMNAPYAHSVVNAVEHPKDRRALEQGLRAFRQARTLLGMGKPGAVEKFEQAATLLERAGNPLYVAVRYRIAAASLSGANDSPVSFDSLVAAADKHSYPGLSAAHSLRAIALGYDNRYLEALAGYQQAIVSAKRDPTAMVSALSRRSGNYWRIGSSELAFRDAFQALALLSNVANLNARNNAYGAAAIAARQLGYPLVALQYQNAAVEAARRGVLDARADGLRIAKRYLLIALRARAEISVELERDIDAQADLEQASDLAEAVDQPDVRSQLKMRIEEVIGQASLKTNPRAAVTAFTKAIELAPDKDSTYLAILHYKRAMARRKAKDPKADEDNDFALTILRKEAKNLVDSSKRGAYENLWTAYFSRFQAMHHDMIEGLISDNDREGAFVYAEQARGFEPMHLILQSRFAVPGFQAIETKEHLHEHLANLPDDTVILQYLVLNDHTYVWALTRNDIRLYRQRRGRTWIAGWVGRIESSIQSDQSTTILQVMRSAYDELFQTALAEVAPRHRKRIVIVPDGPMHGLAFAALQSGTDEFLIERSTIAIAGSTSLYLYALERDRRFPPNPRPAVLVVGDPDLDLHHAKQEAVQLGRDYPNAKVLLGGNATTQNFLASARTATIIHFAGHGDANPQAPSSSMLHLARQGKDSGELTAGRLMAELSELERTRLVVLAACSTAGGVTVGPEGVAPLVRPILAANVPAVIGTLWEVKDATVKNLLVSLHCHYRNGDDVAVALQQAQLEMLRKKEPAKTWAAFQVVGYAGSPYATHFAMEKPPSDHICTPNSLHRPDGFRPQ